MSRLPTIGILGGMGPRATVEFERRLVQLFVGNDQAIPPIVSINDGSIPDRTRFLLGEGADPHEKLAAGAKQLLAYGATIICMPCNTAHAEPILGRLQARLALPLVHMPASCLDEAAMRGYRSVLILGTEGTRLSGVFENTDNADHDVPHDAPHNVRCRYPRRSDQAVINRVIAIVKRGKPITTTDILRLRRIISASGTDGAILACTELSLIRDRLPKQHVIDSLDVLARRCHEQAIMAYTGREGANYDAR